MILVDAVNSSKNSLETYSILPQTCSRFNDILKRKKDALLPHIHMKFPDSVFDSLPRFHDKIKVSVKKIMKIFVPRSGVATSLIVTNLGKYSWYLIERYCWKLNEKAIPSEEKKDKFYWLKNNLYHLHFKDEEILWSPTTWLNDHIVDLAQKLISKKLGADDDYQSCDEKWTYPTTSWWFWTLATYFL